MDDTIYIMPDEIEVVTSGDYSTDVAKHFSSMPEVAKPLLRNAKAALHKVEEMLYSTPAFINAVKASIPEETLQAVLTDEQKSKIANGALKLMTKKDGSLMANLVNPETKKIVSTVSLKNVKVSPEISRRVTTQMQMAQIAEQIQLVQVAVEEVRQGQESDRLATAYSCQQSITGYDN